MVGKYPDRSHNLAAGSKLINGGTFLACSTFSAKCKFIAQVDDRQIRDFKVRFRVCNIFMLAIWRPYLAFTANPFQEHLAICPKTLCYFWEIVVKGNSDSCARLGKLLEPIVFTMLPKRSSLPLHRFVPLKILNDSELILNESEWPPWSMVI